jgi:diguanylate cyclase (GGDEF)-like protein
MSEREHDVETEVHVRHLMTRIRSGGAVCEDFELANGEVIRFRSVSSPGGGRMLSSSNVTDLVRQAEQLRVLASVDPLTGAANRRQFVERATTEWNRFARYRQPLSMIALDIDLFKAVNDRFGHDVGDEVIKLVATTCMACIRTSDTLGRMGGEEFAILLPQTELESAKTVAERIRRVVEHACLNASEHHVLTTVSIGVAQADSGMVKVDELLKRADEALYTAKRNGRNCVILAVNDVAMDLNSNTGAAAAAEFL